MNKETFIKFLERDLIKNNITDIEFEKIKENFDEFKNKYNKNLEELQIDEEVLSAIIFYNIIKLHSDLKNRKRSKESKACIFSIKNLSDLVGISSKTFSKFNLDLLMEKESTQIKDEKSLVKLISKNRRKTKPVDLTKRNLINIFNYNYQYLSFLYSDKSAIKIKEYLIHVKVSLYLAGYIDISIEKLQELFGEYCMYLNMQLTDGRNSEDFVKVKNKLGNEDFKVYIELMR